MVAVAATKQREVEEAREKLQKLQKMKEEKLLEMRAFKLELEQKRAAMKHEAAAMREAVFDQLSENLAVKVEQSAAASPHTPVATTAVVNGDCEEAAVGGERAR